MIRTFQPGDEEAQAAIYNEAAGRLPGFKPATADEVRRRMRSPMFDAHLRFYAIEGNQPVGYVALNRNGRASCPWCKAGFEALRGSLFDALENAARKAGMHKLYAAYRGDWPEPAEFLMQRGFKRVREMVNFVVEVIDLPTMSIRGGLPIRRMRPDDLPALRKMGGALFADLPANDLQKQFFANPSFPAESLFVLHTRASDEPIACAILVGEDGFADPRKVDAAMPCFRLGAFGNELQDTKRIRGMFSFLAAAEQDTMVAGLDLLGHAARALPDDVEAIAGQVQSDRPELLKFYQRYFRRQGSFPVFERELT